MTATYDITTNVGKVRLRSGDNILASAAFTDEEIEVFLSDNDNNVIIAAADLLDAWAAQYSLNADSETIGDYGYRQSVAKKLSDRASKLRELDATTPAMDIASMNLTAGSAITAEED
jgi:hypothetical protein